MHIGIAGLGKMGAAHGIPPPVAAQTLTVFDEASAAGMGRRDCASISAYWPTKVGQ